MSLAHGNPGPPGGGVDSDVERVSGLDDEEFLRLLRSDVTLSPLRLAVNSARSRRFMNDVATVVNMVRIRISDLLFCFSKGMTLSGVLQRHHDSLHTLVLVEVLCHRIEVTGKWGYSGDQQQWLRERLDNVVGVSRRIIIQSAGSGVVSKPAEAGSRLEDPPYLLGVLFSFISPAMRALPLARMLGLIKKGTWSADGKCFFPKVRQDILTGECAGVLWSAGVCGGHDMGDLSLVCQGNIIICIQFTMSWRRQFRGKSSQFLPRACSLDLNGPPADRIKGIPAPLVRTPRRDAAYLTLASEAWTRRFGQLPVELKAIVEGNYCISKVAQNLRPIFRKNLASWEDNPEAQEALWPVIAKMLFKGVLEYIARHCRLPLCILAVGAVPKSTEPFWRLVTDCRPINEFADDWRVKYVSLKSLRLIIGRNCLFWVVDLEAAYHLCVLGGCGRPWKKIIRWIIKADETGYEGYESRLFGCDAEDCSNACDKAMLAVCLENHYMRLCCTQFGHKTSHGPLAILTEAFILYISRNLGLDGASYVDDLYMALMVLLHGDCAGLEGGCSECERHLPRARKMEQHTKDLMDELHLTRSDKGSEVGQKGTYIGVIIDSHTGRFNLTQKKIEKMMNDFRVILESDMLSPRQVSKFRGKLINYSNCVEGTRPFSVPFTLFIGTPTSDWEWDRMRSDIQELKMTARFLYDIYPRLAAEGTAIWEQEPSTIFDLWRRGVSLPFRLLVATYDASKYGVSVSLRENPGEIKRLVGRRYENVSTVSTFAMDLTEQVHREGWAGDIAAATAMEVVPEGAYVLLLRNDCAGALSALVKGSSRSPQLQAASESVNKRCLRRGWVLRALHVSGERLIEEGVDDASRSKAKDLQGPKCGPLLRRRIFAVLATHGVQVTIDMFASSCNALVPRFNSWSLEPENEHTDSFTMRTWESSMCPGCGERHKEYGFYFPPPGLEDRVVTRARSDGVRGCFLVPTRHRAGYWMALRRAATFHLLLPESECKFEHTKRDMGAYTLFLVDFGGPGGSTDPCRAAGLRRARGREPDPLEDWEREELRRNLGLFDGDDSQTVE